MVGLIVSIPDFSIFVSGEVSWKPDLKSVHRFILNIPVHLRFNVHANMPSTSLTIHRVVSCLWHKLNLINVNSSITSILLTLCEVVQIGCVTL